MNDSGTTSNRRTRGLQALRWAARLAGLASCAGMAALAYSQRMNPAQMAGDDLLLFLFFPAAVGLGLVLGWRWELAGGALAVAGWLAFQLAHGFVVGTICKDWEVNVLSAAGLLFLLSGLLRAKTKTRAAPAPSLTPQPAQAGSDTQNPAEPPGPTG